MKSFIVLKPRHFVLHSAFTPTTRIRMHHCKSLNSSNNEYNENGVVSERRQFLSSLASSAALVSAINVPSASAVDDDLTRGGVKLTPFNGLAFQYRGNANGGLDASTLNEDSIPYIDFLKRLDSDEVEFVEFLAPNGDAAYVTFKAKEGEEKMKPIRIGEGYPIEDPEGWSSPAFVVKVSSFSRSN